MKRIHLLIAAGSIAAASALPASAHVYWSFGFGIGYPGVYAGYGWPAPAYYPRPYYRHWYPGYYPYPRYVYPAYLPRYPYGYPAYAYVPRQYAGPPAPRIAATGQRRKDESIAAIPSQRFEKITLSAKELFAFDEYQIQGSQPKLDEIAKALKENASIGNVTITGYTDRLGSNDYNLALSKRRAESVKLYLTRQGVDGSRLNIVGKGEADPLVKCDEKDQQALIKCLEPNRRVEITPFTIERKVGPGSSTG